MTKRYFQAGRILIILSLFIELILIAQSDYILTCGIGLIDILSVVAVGAGCVFFNEYLYGKSGRYYSIIGMFLGLPNIFLGVMITSVIC
ncbi:MAG: hypothetical protein KDD10_25155 [Phaeodactylibacter sp.]|nr:hypothetical protein [Phaeodactylibacter sp.]